MEGIGKRPLDSFTGDAVQTAAPSAEAFGHIQIFLVPTMGSKTSLYTHGNPPLILSGEAEIRPAGYDAAARTAKTLSQLLLHSLSGSRAGNPDAFPAETRRREAGA